MIFIDAWRWILANPQQFVDALLQHLLMCGLALLFSLLLALPIGVKVAASPRATFIATNIASTLRTIPSLAILAAALPFLGIGLLPSVVALVILALPPILLNTCTSIQSVDKDTLSAAQGMGLTRAQITRQVILPLAAPGILAGIRTAAVQVIGGAALASFIGGGGLGDFVTTGIAIMDMSRLLVGAIPIILLAIGAELLFAAVEKSWFKHVPKG
ncbi:MULTISPECIES: ABC transporter permease [unclassified Brenneria]|uniref:ABC transporter permease n=1 Tax=unclassified Brenneria TaxID=2634434 RepID=UPI0015559F14|nr:MULTISPECIES: ABC transporter permease [unclassified Brenneria]MBJ7222205.1 ABC transporter permease [Brenneria sp. L3-3C-1]MEE3643448.1 ABC transporter permease [Brenneria sp. L3_3C_1]MEE3651632.1 ABC transporter permease [Brenneria sp. HEZEL_4_2_4]NPD01589.1 ABC transporter permease [Brenneria sp. hezel4-2-4]